VFYSCYYQTQLKTIQHPSYIISRFVIFFCFLFSVLPNFWEHIFLARTSISALFKNIIAHIYKLNIELCGVAHGPKSLATPGQENFNFELVNLLSTRANGFSKVTNELL